MHSLSVLLLISASGLVLISAQIRTGGIDDDSSFDITSPNNGHDRDTGRGSSSSSNRDRDSGSSSGQRRSPSSDRLTGSRDSSGQPRRSQGDRSSGSGRGSARFPDFVRVEVELIELEDNGGVLANGKSCDTFDN